MTHSHIVHHGNSSSSITNDTEFVDMYVRTDYTTESLKYCSAISLALATNTTIEATSVKSMKQMSKYHGGSVGYNVNLDDMKYF